MTAQTFDLQAMGVEELSPEDAMRTNGGNPVGWLASIVVGVVSAVIWDTVKEIYNTWDEFVESFWSGVYGWDEAA